MELQPVPARRLTYTYEDSDRDPIRRLREMIMFISARSTYDRAYGVTKLNKLLWWSDTRAFGELGKPITGIPYVRLPQGPVPDGIEEVRERMQAEGLIAISPIDHYGRTIQRVVPLRRHDVSLFSGPEIAIVDSVIEENSKSNATGVSRRSHGRMWEALKQGQRMPYESVFISDAKPSRYDMARTRELARQYGWQ